MKLKLTLSVLLFLLSEKIQLFENLAPIDTILNFDLIIDILI